MGKNQILPQRLTNWAISLLILTLFILLSALNSLNAQNWNQVVKTVATDRAPMDEFGYAVAISGDYAIVGAYREDNDTSGTDSLSNAGSAYILRNIAGNWTLIQKLVASDRSSNDFFGHSVAIFGDYAIIGAHLEDENVSGANTLSSSGSAYIFKNNNGTWSQIQKIVASDRGANDWFGISVAISGAYLIVGANREDEDSLGSNNINGAGSAYIFKNISGTWSQVQKIVASDRGPNDLFGNSVSIWNNYLIVGAHGEDEDENGANPIENAGSAYIFANNSGSWIQVQKIVAPDRGIDDYFGFSVAISRDIAIIGAYLEDEDTSGGNTRSNSGSAYIFKNNIGAWTLAQKIVASNRGVEDWFGFTVAISGDFAIVGAYKDDQNSIDTDSLLNAGSAYIFNFNNGVWSQVQKVVASDRGINDEFGYAVAISGDYAIVGARQEDHNVLGLDSLYSAGAVYLYKKSATLGIADNSFKNS
ncbi:MAG: FG-GAP repeat protein, partial [Bacteroidia bacterium]|nr:FG-GAP repeat protein [Bacteroidia bacterium]